MSKFIKFLEVLIGNNEESYSNIDEIPDINELFDESLEKDKKTIQIIMENEIALKRAIKNGTNTNNSKINIVKNEHNKKQIENSNKDRIRKKNKTITRENRE